jgi:acetylornithine/succinyldiaminopimelate/putrescine aminotransferase
VTLLADPDDPETRQPYHAGLDTHESRAAKAVKRLVKAVERFAHRSVAKLIADYRAAGHRVRGAGIVAGSVIDPARIPNDHIRAHAEEGRLFRTVRVLVEKELWVTGARLRKGLTALGENVEGPWRAEEKAAALAAWMMLKL